MSLIDVSRKLGRHKKRDVSVATYTLSGTEIGDMIANGEALITDSFLLGVLPTNILITASTTTVLVPFDAGVVNVGTSPTGTEFASAVDLTAAANTVVPGSGDISVQTGPVVAANFTGSPTVGLAVVNIEYIEYEQCTGELTNFVPAP